MRRSTRTRTRRPPPPPPKIDGPVLGIVYENTFGSRHEVVKRYGDRLEALYRAN